MSHSLSKLLRGNYKRHYIYIYIFIHIDIGNSIGDYTIGVIDSDTRSLDYGSHEFICSSPGLCVAPQGFIPNRAFSGRVRSPGLLRHWSMDVLLVLSRE